MEVYAEISRKIFNRVEAGELRFCLPDGVSFSRRLGSRSCFFECEYKEAFDILTEALDDAGIQWQGSWDGAQVEESAPEKPRALTDRDLFDKYGQSEKIS